MTYKEMLKAIGNLPFVYEVTTRTENDWGPYRLFVITVRLNFSYKHFHVEQGIGFTVNEADLALPRDTSDLLAYKLLYLEREISGAYWNWAKELIHDREAR